MWDPYSVGSLLYRDPVLGDPAMWVLCCSRILFWEVLLYRDPASEDPAMCGFPVLRDPGMQKPCSWGNPV